MPSKPEGERSDPGSAELLTLKNELLELWGQLPPTHQASLVLALVREVQKGEWGEWLIESIALEWPEDDDFPFSRLRPAVTVEPTEPLPVPERKSPTDFDEWMQEVDRAVWRMAGCSVHDLPDIDFRELFEDGATPWEAADDALMDGDFSRFE